VVLVAAVLTGFGGGIFLSNVDEKETPTANPQTETGPETDAGEPFKTASITVELVDWNQWPATDEPVGIEVTAEARGYTRLSYDGLRLCAYGENGTVLFNKTVGTLRSPDSGTFYHVHTVNMTTTTAPAYVTVDHPSLRNDTRVAVDVLTWDDETERLDQHTSDSQQSLVETFDGLQDEFPFPRTHEIGRCG
jgi:hypothetical protein